MTLDLAQRKHLAQSVWNARDFVIDCREDCASADSETLRQLAISINHLAHIAEKLEELTPEDELQWGKKLKAYKKEDAIHDEHLYLEETYQKINKDILDRAANSFEEETQAEHDLDVNMNRYAGAH